VSKETQLEKGARLEQEGLKLLQINIPPKRYSKLSVAIPASLVSDIPHLREKTSKIGFVGRALAMFRVDEVVIFPDMFAQNQVRDAELVAKILSYLETPQYLRRLLFRIEPELRYSGVLPPLRTPHHPVRNREKDLVIGEYREGVVASKDKNSILVEVGVERPALILNENVPVNTRVTVKIVEKGKNLKAQLMKPDDVHLYWGYKVTVSNKPFGRMIREMGFDLVLATSRLGEPFMKVADKIRTRWNISRHVLVAFGAPAKGLHEIVKQEKLDLAELVDFIVNTVPNQATETVRTEEALYATLAALNLLVLQ
jgi:predicted SPOUT superfamily RNA methylase MTH1